MHHFKQHLLLLSLLPLAASAQEPYKHEPSPVKLEDFVVTTLPFRRSQIDVAQSTTVLTSTELDLRSQPSIGETLAQQPGMSSSYFGPGASRPIIRGLGGDRIRMLGDGLGTMDASTVSPDHGVSLEPMLVERIEILRGPASLLYGSSAVGGVVNTITHRIHLEEPERAFQGRMQVRMGAANDEIARSLNTDLRLASGTAGTLVLHLDGLRRESDDLRIPGYALSEGRREEEKQEALEHGEPEPDFARGRLPNSAIETEAASAGLSWIGDTFSLGANRSSHYTHYGVPGHEHAHEEEEAQSGQEGVSIDLLQRRWDIQGVFNNSLPVFDSIKAKAAVTRYRHLEIEDGEVGTRFDNNSREMRIELGHGQAKSTWQGALGLHASREDFSAEGDEAFLPASRKEDLALFLFEEAKKDALTFQWGVRVGTQSIRLKKLGAERQDTVASAALGMVWSLDDRHSLTWSLSRTERAPNAQELHANGPHTGTQSFEVGDASLAKERAHSAEVSFRRKSGRITGEATLFLSAFDGYIREQRTGERALHTDEGWLLVKNDAAEDHGSLPVYRMVGAKALLWGAEAETYVHLHEAGLHRLDLRLAGDITLSRSLGRSLPRTAPARLSLGLRWERGPWLAGFDVQGVFRQGRVAEGETTTGGHTLLAAHVGRHIDLRRTHIDILLSASNLLNEEARVHSSFLKELVPLAGRAISLSLSLSF